MKSPVSTRTRATALMAVAALAAAMTAAAACAAREAPADSAASAKGKLPAFGAIRYSVTHDGVPFEIGQATHTWKLENGRYVLRAETETTGVAAMIRHVRINHVSEGEMTESGFRPLSFRVERDGKLRDAARFDWQRKVLEIASGDSTTRAELLEGSQDLLSAFYQIALAPPEKAIPVFPVTNGRKYYKERVDVLGHERIETPIGTVRTLQIQIGQPGEQRQTRVWMALDHANLPVRIRFVDHKGGVSEQRVVSLEYPGIRKGGAAQGSAARAVAGTP